MADIQDEFLAKARAEAEERRTINNKDLADEREGRVTGRARRFLTEGAHDARDEKHRTDARAKQISQLQLLLANDAIYASLYKETAGKLDQAEKAAEKALILALAVRKKAEDLLQETLERAQRLPDGMRIFRDAQGHAWAEDGRQLDEGALEAIEWRGNEPSYEDYLAHKQSAEQAQKDIEAIEGYQVNVLGRARDRMADEDNPPMKDELEKIQLEVDSRMPESVRVNRADQSPVKPEIAQNSASLDIPKV